MKNLSAIVLALGFLIPSVSAAATLSHEQVSAIISLLTAFGVEQSIISAVQQDLAPPSLSTSATNTYINSCNGSQYPACLNGSHYVCPSTGPGYCIQNATQDLPHSPAGILQISSISIAPTQTTANISWQTSVPTESKVFVSGGGLDSTVFNSLSGLSTLHSVPVKSLNAGTTYTYTIEAIANGITDVKQSGTFTTNPLPQFLSGPTAVIKIAYDGGDTSNAAYPYIASILWTSDRPSYVVASPIAFNEGDPSCKTDECSSYNWRNNWQSMRRYCTPLPVGSLAHNTTYTCTFTIADNESGATTEKDVVFTTP